MWCSLVHFIFVLEISKIDIVRQMKLSYLTLSIFWSGLRKNKTFRLSEVSVTILNVGLINRKQLIPC